ncbi:MAG: hypothetical protein PHV30_09505 [Candidatus Margulisbacteria bacterium]|nr:hypothetical protein [Candidatus Margulisiibacteriota bacterium]
MVVRRIFNYIENYLCKHDEEDILDIDFITNIAIFLDTSLVPIHFRREEKVLFKEVNRLSITSSMKSQIKNIIKELIHHSIIEKYRKYDTVAGKR